MSEALIAVFGPRLPLLVVACVLLAGALLYGGLWVRTFGQATELTFVFKAGSAAVAVGAVVVLFAVAAYPFKWYVLPDVLEVLGVFGY